MTTILNGQATALTIREEVAADVKAFTEAGHRPPGLAAVLVGDDPASIVYVRNKKIACEKAGMVGRTVILPSSTSQEELESTLDELNADDTIDGILLQLPLPDHLDERPLLERIDPQKDVDSFHPENVGKLWLGQQSFRPATPAGIMELLKRHNVPLQGKKAVVVGRSAIVGKPMAAMLLEAHCTVTICHSRTQDLAAVTREADILVAAVGRQSLLGAEHIKEGAVVIDVGIHRVTDEAEIEHLFPGDEKRRDTYARRGAVLVGDVDFTRAASKASLITPVPGGVGPLTIAMLLVNTLEAAKRRQSD